MLRELLYIPNLLSMSRILLAPLVIVCFDSLWWLFAIGLYTGVSDYLDGYFARKLGQSSRLGAILDPLGDKILVLMFLIAAISRGLLPPWMLIALLFRDLYTFMATMAYLIFFKKRHGNLLLAARFPGKLVTLLQFFCLAMLTLCPYAIWRADVPLYHWRNWTFLLLYPSSIWACIDYQRYYWKATRPGAHTNEPTVSEEATM